MKKLLINLVLLSTGVAFAQSDYILLEANIANRNSDSLYIVEGNNLSKLLVIKDGVFKDTLKVKTGMYFIYDGKESTNLFLKNGYDLKLSLDAKQFDETIVYTGKGAEVNNYLAKYFLTEETFDYDKLLASKTEAEFVKGIDSKINGDISKLKSSKLDKDFIALFEGQLKQTREGYLGYFKEKLKMAELNGKPSPSFDFENIKGGKTKLSDLKGKYVYIDIWATWCGPCRQEIPHLQKLEEQFHDKNIEFVSISIDEKKDHEKWQKFVKEKNLGGIQLFADNAWQSSFVTAYNIQGIPRFILLDPNGNIVSADELRPSSPQIAEKLSKLVK